ncbi:MAG: WxL domain-containing protein [Enterococcus canintestini]|uniref:WxL domain-containing protein n=1 Tax=Enterococcus canintestini TaxID=317010 RepID=UPI0039949C18
MRKLVVLFMLTMPLVLVTNLIAYADKDTEGEVEYVAGDLEFDYTGNLPDSLNFGEHPLQTTMAETWIATDSGDQADPPTTGSIDVKDNRGNPDATWSVKLVQEEQFMAGSHELSAATLVLEFGSVTNNLDQLPTVSNSPLTIAAINTEMDIMTAGANQGAGETSRQITKFELNVPANTEKVADQYTTTLNWIFSSTPTNPGP